MSRSGAGNTWSNTHLISMTRFLFNSKQLTFYAISCSKVEQSKVVLGHIGRTEVQLHSLTLALDGDE